MWSSVVESLFPVLLMILLGVGLRKFSFMPEVCFHGLNKLAFWVGLPCMLFMEISGARVQGGFRGNLAYVGIPVVYYALSANPEARAVAVLALAPTIPIFNVFCVLLLLKPGSGRPGQRALRTLLAISGNPLIIGCVLGLLALHLQIKLPTSVLRAVEGVGRIGLPAALMALGASLTLERVKGRGWLALGSAAIKVVLAPVIGYTIARALGLTDDWLMIAVLYSATPTAVASFVMADQMGADKDLAAAIIVISTLLAFPALAIVLLLFH